MTGAVAAVLPNDRLHLQHGPIDLIIGAEGERRSAFDAAISRFEGLLAELVDELAFLRMPVSSVRPAGPVARRMYDAVLPHRDGVITPMAAVAGAVAGEILATMTAAATLRRAYVNNGGDIALHLTRDATYKLSLASLTGENHGAVTIRADDQVRGIATSGRGGRSFSLGIADSVTVLAKTSAQADAAATMIGNAVDLPGHPAISRRKARELQHDSDLRDHLVVTGVGYLTAAETAKALVAGQRVAEAMVQAGLIVSAALFLREQHRVCGIAHFSRPQKDKIHA